MIQFIRPSNHLGSIISMKEMILAASGALDRFAAFSLDTEAPFCCEDLLRTKMTKCEWKDARNASLCMKHLIGLNEGH